jgi:hypothetical protein
MVQALITMKHLVSARRPHGSHQAQKDLVGPFSSVSVYLSILKNLTGVGDCIYLLLVPLVWTEVGQFDS